MSHENLKAALREVLPEVLAEIDTWEIGQSHYYTQGNGAPIAPGLILRRKRRVPVLHQAPGYYEDVVEVPFAELLRKIFVHCGIEIVIKPATQASWHFKREGDKK